MLSWRPAFVTLFPVLGCRQAAPGKAAGDSWQDAAGVPVAQTEKKEKMNQIMKHTLTISIVSNDLTPLDPSTVAPPAPPAPGRDRGWPGPRRAGLQGFTVTVDSVESSFKLRVTERIGPISGPMPGPGRRRRRRRRPGGPVVTRRRTVPTVTVGLWSGAESDESLELEFTESQSVTPGLVSACGRAQPGLPPLGSLRLAALTLSPGRGPRGMPVLGLTVAEPRASSHSPPA